METATKNKQSFETINRMVAKAFHGLNAENVLELKEGFFNVAYLVALSDGREVILKIAPPKDSLIMTHEKNIMLAEVESMKLVKDKTDIPVAEILCYDHSHSICTSDYFFMSKIEGKSLNTISDALSEVDKVSINYHLGKFNAKMNSIVGDRFGYYSQPDKQDCNWYPAFSSIINDAIHDARALKIDIGVEYDAVNTILLHYKSCFDEVTVPKLVHWDLWAGNIFIENNKISGLIDFERCLWADELMEVGFRSQNQDENFLKGYGIGEFTDTQKARIKWYDLYLLLIVSLECDYRKYPDHEQLNWAKERIKKTVELLENMY